jgi:hypothetical protein
MVSSKFGLGMALLEEGPFTQDEGVGIELEVRCVVKDDLADVRLLHASFPPTTSIRI